MQTLQRVEIHIEDINIHPGLSYPCHLYLALEHSVSTDIVTMLRSRRPLATIEHLRSSNVRKYPTFPMGSFYRSCSCDILVKKICQLYT